MGITHSRNLAFNREKKLHQLRREVTRARTRRGDFQTRRSDHWGQHSATSVLSTLIAAPPIPSHYESMKLPGLAQPTEHQEAGSSQSGRSAFYNKPPANQYERGGHPTGATQTASVYFRQLSVRNFSPGRFLRSVQWERGGGGRGSYKTEPTFKPSQQSTEGIGTWQTTSYQERYASGRATMSGLRSLECLKQKRFKTADTYTTWHLP